MSNNKRSGISRRDFLKRVGLAGTTLALGNFSTAFGQGKYGGTLRVSLTRGVTKINPIMHISGANWLITKWMYNNLTKLNTNREVVPDLAKSWEASDNAREWVFHLREGVKFHTGKEVTAEDVVATVDTVKDDEVSLLGKSIPSLEKKQSFQEHTSPTAT